MPQSDSLEILLHLRDAASAQLEHFEKTLNDIKKSTTSADKALTKTQKTLNGVAAVSRATQAAFRGLAIGGATVLGKALRGMGATIGLVTRSVFSLKGALAGLGLGFLARSFIEAASGAEQYRTRLSVILGSQRKANELFKSMADYASTVSFEYHNIIGSATQLAAVMEGGNAEVEKYIPIIADVAATTGLGIQETTTQIIRMYSAGAASADLFRERGVLAMLGFQAGVSHSAEETRKRLIAAWEDPNSKIRDASLELAKTWEGMLSMVSDAWFQFRELVMEQGVFDFIRGALSTFVEYIRQLKKEGRLDEWAREIATNVVNALEQMIRYVALLVDAWTGLKEIWQVLKIAFGSFASVVNLGMSHLYDVVDAVRQKINELGADAAKVGKVLKYLPATSAIGYMLEGLEQSNVEVGKTGELLRQNAKWWDQVVAESEKELDALAGQELAYNKVNKILDKIRAKAEEYRKASEAEGEDRPRAPLIPELGLADKIKSELTRLKAATATALTELGIFYETGKKSLTDYFDERKRLLDENFKKEKALRQQQLTLVSPKAPKDRQKILDQIYVLEQKYTQDSLKLTEERRKAEIKASADIRAIEESLGKMRQNLISKFDPSQTEARFAEEKAALERQQAEEIQSLIDHKASMADIEEAYRLQQLARDKQAADQRQEVLDKVLEGTKQSISYLNQAFGDLYEASGEQIKEFFYLQKAAAIAETVITTYQNAVLAYQQGLQIPYVGIYLAPVFAATAVAAGLAKVALIASQSLAEGGKVDYKKMKVIPLAKYRKQDGGKIQGTSPHPKADNIPINATAGEFVQPVKSVKYYGERVMELIQKRRIPKEEFDKYADGGKVEHFKSSQTVIKKIQRLAEGGVVVGHSPQTTSDNINIKATAGEFVHPVDVVKYYGIRGMEAIRQKVLPREAIMNFAANIRPPQSNYSYAYQAGGPVSGESDRPPKESSQNINVVNVVDPNMMDQYISTTHGQKNVLNVISQNAFAVKQILSAE